MRLWHEIMIPVLNTQHLIAQHRECCALRGDGWGRKHATVDYVFNHSKMKLYYYHKLVMKEMTKRNFNYDKSWLDPKYNGVHKPYGNQDFDYELLKKEYKITYPIYPEHNNEYLKVCILNMQSKGFNYVNAYFQVY